MASREIIDLVVNLAGKLVFDLVAVNSFRGLVLVFAEELASH